MKNNWAANSLEMSGKIMSWKTTSKNSIRLLWVGYITSNNSIFNSFMICLNGLKVNNLFYNLTAQVCVTTMFLKSVFPLKLYRKYIIIAGLNRLCICYLSWIIHSSKPTQSPHYDIQMEFACWYYAMWGISGLILKSQKLKK